MILRKPRTSELGRDGVRGAAPFPDLKKRRTGALPRRGTLRTRTIWTLAGAAWGLLVGLVTALQTAGFLAGVGWLFIFGDDRWPEAANWVLLGLTSIAGLVPVVLLAWLGRRLGIAFEHESRQRLRTRRRGWFVFALAVGGLALGVGMAAAGALTERARRADREAADRQYARLVEATHRITDVELTAGTPPAVDVLVAVEGVRVGEYLADWRLRDAVYDSTLATGSRTLALEEGAVEFAIAIDTAGVRSAYRRSVLDGAGGAVVHEDFELRVTLRPLLTAVEASRLPDERVRNLELGESGLISTRTAPFPVRFELP